MGDRRGTSAPHPPVEIAESAFQEHDFASFAELILSDQALRRTKENFLRHVEPAEVDEGQELDPRQSWHLVHQIYQRERPASVPANRRSKDAS